MKKCKECQADISHMKDKGIYCGDVCRKAGRKSYQRSYVQALPKHKKIRVRPFVYKAPWDDILKDLGY